jgi:hypothetical protein
MDPSPDTPEVKSSYLKIKVKLEDKKITSHKIIISIVKTIVNGSFGSELFFVHPFGSHIKLLPSYIFLNSGTMNYVVYQT